MDKLLNLLDQIFWATLVAWFALDFLGTPILPLLIISLLGIATIFFVKAHRPIPLDQKGEQKGFGALLGLSIIPKVLGISSSVATIGILFYRLEMEGYQTMLMVGSYTSVIALVILAILKMRGLKLEVATFGLMKSLVVLIFALLIQYNILV